MRVVSEYMIAGLLAAACGKTTTPARAPKAPIDVLDEKPVIVIDAAVPDETFVQRGHLALGYNFRGQGHSCFLKKDGTVACAGTNFLGELGTGKDVDELDRSALPLLVTGLSGVVAIGGGFESPCAIAQNGSVSCWGVYQTFPHAALVLPAYSVTPFQLQGVAGGKTLDAFAIIDTRGVLNRWVYDGSKTATPYTPVGQVTAVSEGQDFRCALSANESVLCWGKNGSGQLGDGTFVDKTVPTQVKDLAHAIAVSAGAQHACAVKLDHTIWCWGSNELHQIGSNATEQKPGGGLCASVPIVIDNIQDAVDVSAGEFFTCALKKNRTVSCWGHNSSGQVGTEPPTLYAEFPQPIVGLENVVELQTGADHVCARTQDDKVYCWGNNAHGQLGAGSAETISPKPLMVQAAP